MWRGAGVQPHPDGGRRSRMVGDWSGWLRIQITHTDAHQQLAACGVQRQAKAGAGSRRMAGSQLVKRFQLRTIRSVVRCA